MFNNDLDEIKQRILDEDLIVAILEHLECENIKPSGNRYEARLPDKFGSRNPRAVQVYVVEGLPSKVRNKSISGNIYTLVSYILYQETIDDNPSNLYKAKVWICNIFGWDEYLNIRDDFEEEKKDYLSFLRPIQKTRKKRERLKKLGYRENNVLDETKVFELYDRYPHINFINDGITTRTQNIFKVMFDRESERVVFPIYNRNSELVSVKGRYVGKDKYVEDEYKYMYLYHFDKSIELYNLYRALPYIVKMGEVIVFEAEKSCMKAYQYRYRNTVSIMGSELSPIQAMILKSLQVNIIFAFDNDMNEEFVRKQAKQITTRKCFYIKDNLNLLREKDSPVDIDNQTWERLYKECLKII